MAATTIAQVRTHTTALEDQATIQGRPTLCSIVRRSKAFGYVTMALKYLSVKALLYYNTVEQWRLYEFKIDMWTDTFNFGGNMDGTLFWAGRPGIEGLSTYEPLVSVRMKLLRQASYFYDLVAQVRTKDPDWVKAQVDALMPRTTTWIRTLSMLKHSEIKHLKECDRNNQSCRLPT
jgi:hypothetical protein